MKRKIFFKRFIGSLVIVLIVNLQVESQETGYAEKVSGGTGYFTMGYSIDKLDGFNEMFQKNGFPEIDRNGIFMGGGGNFIVNNFIIGGEGGGVIKPSSSNDRYQINLSSGYGFLNLGYAIFNNKSLLMYPVIGFGGGGSSVLITDFNAVSTDFNEILNNPQRQTMLTGGGLLINLSVNSDWFFAATKNDKFTGGWLLGIKAGYIFNINHDKWYLNNTLITNTPTADMSGFYIKISIGGGGIKRAN